MRRVGDQREDNSGGGFRVGRKDLPPCVGEIVVQLGYNTATNRSSTFSDTSRGTNSCSAANGSLGLPA